MYPSHTHHFGYSSCDFSESTFLLYPSHLLYVFPSFLSWWPYALLPLRYEIVGHVSTCLCYIPPVGATEDGHLLFISVSFGSHPKAWILPYIYHLEMCLRWLHEHQNSMCSRVKIYEILEILKPTNQHFQIAAGGIKQVKAKVLTSGSAWTFSVPYQYVKHMVSATCKPAVFALLSLNLQWVMYLTMLCWTCF